MIYDYYCVNDQLYIIYSDQNLEIKNQMLEGNENSGSNLSIDSESDKQSGIETQNKKTYVLIYSFENGETPQLDRSLEIDGSYNKSIKIEDRLIVLTNKFFSIGMEYVNKKATMHLEKQRNLPCINGKELEYKSIYITNSNNLCSYLLITSIDTKSDRKDNTNYKCIALLGSTKHININDNDLYIFMNKECDQEKSDPANSKDNTKII